MKNRKTHAQTKKHRENKSQIKKTHTDSLKGKFLVSKSGMGFVEVEGQAIDVKVKPEYFENALHGDIVEVVIYRFGAESKRPEGMIVNIVKRNVENLVGTIEVSDKYAFFVPSNPNIHTDFFVPLDKLKGAVNKQKVLVGNLSWKKDKKNPFAEVIEVITGERENDLAMKEIILENGFPMSFSDKAIKEMEHLSDKVTKRDLNERRDFREILTFTIDPVDAKDFDDAISFRELDDNWREIGVHIADVSHFVQEGTQLDKEAFERATSVYLPDRVNPMLPEKISNELCSLRPYEDKFCFSAVFEINKDAEIRKKWIGRTLIHSNRRYTYEEVQEVIEGGDETFKDELLWLNELSQKFRKKRFESGAINFSSKEVRFVLDEKGSPIGIKIKESKESHQLIEELMLLANKTVAEYVSMQKVKKHPVPFPYRIHDLPNTDKLQPFMAFAGKYGITFDITDEKTIAASFNKMVEAVKGRPELAVLESLGIRTMAKAIYSTENIGHYGLAFENYCHFTSPIRRYPDILVHRVLQQCLDRDIQADKLMEQKSIHCTQQEIKAMEAERDANKYKQVEYLGKHIGETFDAVVSGIANHGFWCQTIEHFCEGFVSLQNVVKYDSFVHVPENYELIGMHTRTRIRMGDKVKILVASANLIKRTMDFEWIIPEHLLLKDNIDVIKKKKS